MFQSLFSLSLHYHRLISINCNNFCFLFLIIVLFLLSFQLYTNMVLFDIGYCFELAFQWFETKLMSLFIHILLSLLPFIPFPFLFQTLTLISFSFSYYQSTILMSIFISIFIVVAILICLVVCWTWIDNGIQTRHRFNPSIMHSWDKNKSKWWKKEWLFVYNILVTECRFVSYDNLIIVIHCIKWASFSLHVLVG